MVVSNLSGKCLKTVNKSAASDHLPECSYSIYFDHFDVLASDTNKFRFLIKESLFNKRKQVQIRQNQLISIKAIRLRHFIESHCACSYGNIESDKGCIWIKIVSVY